MTNQSQTKSIAILSARFQPLPAAIGPGWVMRVSCASRKILHRALPFVAKVGEQRVEALAVNNDGTLFEGYLRKMPLPGDRLRVGYSDAQISTQFVYQPGNPPSVA